MGRDQRLTKATEAEAAVLGAILLHNDAVEDLRAEVSPDDFDAPGYRATYEAMLGLAKEGHPIDTVTVQRQMSADGTLNLIGGLEGIGRLSDRYATTGNVLYHAELVRDAAHRRRLISAAQALVEAASKDDRPAGEIAEEYAGGLGRLADGREQLRTAGELATLAVDAGIGRMRGEKEHMPLPTGLPALDAAIGGGLEPSTLVIVCARPGNGKTALTTCMQLNLASAGEPVFVQQMDMGALQTGRRLIGARAPLGLKYVKHPTLTKHVDTMMATRDDLASLSIRFSTKRTTPQETRAAIRAWRRRNPKNTGAAFIDYGQLHIDDGSHARKDLWLGEMVGEYKGLALDLGLPVVVCMQLNRGVEQRDNKRPRKSDLRDSGQIEEVADVILGLYREHYYNPKADMHVAEALLLKHRDEGTKTDPGVILRFEPYYCRFLEADVNAPDGANE